MPRVSVILPVYNGNYYLTESIDSILSQTFADFEFIIINDGSQDDSRACVAMFNDPRIVYVEQSNIGLAATLNRGIEMAKGEYVARQDQDDISLPNRLELQVDFLDKHPDVGMVGTWAEIFSDVETGKRFHKHPTNNLELKLHLHFRNPFVHSSITMRTDVVRQIGGYATAKNRQPPEDYELWSRMARSTKLANIGQVLVRYREVSTSMSRLGVDPFSAMVYKIACENVSYTLCGQSLAQYGNDLVSTLQRFPQPLVIFTPWTVLESTLNVIVDQLTLARPDQKKELLKMAIEFLKSARTDHDLARIPLVIRSSSLFGKFKFILRHIYRIISK